MRRLRLVVLSSHPIQYYAPLFRELATKFDLHVFFAHMASQDEQASAGFGVAFDWDVDLLSGYSNSFLTNVSERPGTNHFSGCDTPEVFQLLQKEKPDVLLVMGWHLKSFLQGVFAAKRLGIPVMVRGDSHLQTQRSAVKIWAKAILYPPFLSLFDAALYVGQRSKAYYNHYRYPASRLFFSPHCIDNDWFANRATTDEGTRLRNAQGIANGVTVLLFAGKLLPFKRPLDLISAAILCRQARTRIEVMVVGDGELRSEIVHYAATNGIALHMLGFRNQSEMPAAYAASDMLVLPSDGRESWGLVANEALACGKPIVVSSACGCAPDLAEDQSAGQVFPIGDAGQMVHAIDLVIKNPPSKASIGDKSSAYSITAAVDGISRAAEFCVGNKSWP